MIKKLPITLAIFAKNNEDSIGMCIESVLDIVSEIVVVNTGSTDKTVEIAMSYGARLYHVNFSDFGAIRTLTAHLARELWVLGLDTDEILCPEDKSVIETLIRTPRVGAWGLPRRRWADLDRKNQVETEAYPDYQYRLIKNDPSRFYYTDRIHERLVHKDPVLPSPAGPHIEHFQDVFKKGQKLKERNSLYKKLYEEDLKHGIKHEIPAVTPIDDKEE